MPSVLHTFPLVPSLTSSLSLPSSLYAPPPPSCFPHTLCMCLCHVVDRPSLWPLQYVRYMEKKTLWCAYWVGLGILSSVGLGTGLHTFLLYLVRTVFWTLLNKLSATFTVQSFTCPCTFVTEVKLKHGAWWWCSDAGLKSLCRCCIWVVAKALGKHYQKLLETLKAFAHVYVSVFVWVCARMHFGEGRRFIAAVVAALFWQAVQEQSHSLTPLTECTWG